MSRPGKEDRRQKKRDEPKRLMRKKKRCIGCHGEMEGIYNQDLEISPRGREKRKWGRRVKKFYSEQKMEGRKDGGSGDHI